VLVVAVAFVAGCGIGWADYPISEVVVDDDGRTVTVGFHCHRDASVRAAETDSEVRLTLRVYRNSEGDCAASDTVTLEAPIGDRRLIDADTGKALRKARENCYRATEAYCRPP
jgi:hypothetical protein